MTVCDRTQEDLRQRNIPNVFKRQKVTVIVTITVTDKSIHLYRCYQRVVTVREYTDFYLLFEIFLHDSYKRVYQC